MTEWALIERTGEIATLRANVHRLAQQSISGFVMIEGPAGIGKSRLTAETRLLAGAADLTVLSARGTEMEREHTYGLVRQLFEPALATCTEQQRRELLAGAAAAAAPLLGFTDDTQDPVGEFAAMHGLFWLTANLCQDRPSVLLLDDLHWSDSASLRFLAYLLPRLESLAVLMIGSLRTGEPGTDKRLLDVIVSDPTAVLIRPAPLSRQAVAQLLRTELGSDIHPDFVRACHTATAGNPLMLRHVASTVSADGLAATAENAAQIASIGSRAVSLWVSRRLSAMSADAMLLAHAAAIMDDGADLRDVVAVAGLDFDSCGKALQELERTEILVTRTSEPGQAVGFVHPMIRRAVYDSLGRAWRAAGHSHAAQILTAKGAAPERVAAHLMLTPPAGNDQVVTVLRDAARSALDRGAPESAYSYLQRCLREHPESERQTELMIQIGNTATLVDITAAAEFLRQAYSSTHDRYQRAQIACLLGAVLVYHNRVEESLTILLDAAVSLPESDIDLRRRVQSYLLNVLIVEPGKQELVGQLHSLWNLEPEPSIGARLLDCVIAFHDMKQCRPEAVDRARRAIADGLLVAQANGEAPLTSAWVVLATADDDGVMASIDAAITQARSRGATRDLGPAHAFRALAWLVRGNLAEAESDAEEARRAVDTARVDVGRNWIAPYLADALMEQGRLDAADAALDWAHVPSTIPSTGSSYLVLAARARLLRLRNKPDEALDAALTCGRMWEASNGLNPAFLSWRSDAALCLHAMGRHDEARDYADEEVRLARRWQAPGALGRALRIAGLVHQPNNGLKLLTEATMVLESSPARLEYAKSLVELGALLRASGSNAEARQRLRDGAQLADHCGAEPVVQRARVELVASGGRLRRITSFGLESLSPSERRVAELAAGGRSNREVAEQLFITTKTVELHLTSIYRKLGTNKRTELVNLLA